MVAISGEYTLTEQARMILDQTGFSMPVDAQLGFFLRELWSPLAFDRAIVGIGAQQVYTDKTTGKLASTMKSHWCFAEDRLDPETTQWHKWSLEQNNDPKLVRSGSGSIFYYIASRLSTVITRFNARGRNDELVQTAAFVGDVDCAKEGYNLLDVYAALYRLPLPPTGVIFSGGGLQPYWFTDEPIDLTIPETIQEYKYRSRSLMKPLEAMGFKPDYDVHEAGRMMRACGYVNRKPERMGAIALILAHNERARYTLTTITTHTTYDPPAEKLPTKRVEGLAEGQFQVDDTFLQYLVYGNLPGDGNRHKLMRHLALVASHAGIPADVLFPRLQAAARRWYADEPGDEGPEGELERLVDWAYRHQFADFPAGHWLVRATNDGFEKYIAEETGLRERVVDLPEPPERPVTLPLDLLREEHAAMVAGYLDETFHNVPTIFIDMAPPGAGKSYTVIHEMIRWVKETGGKALFLTQYKWNWETGPDKLRALKVAEADLHLFGYFIAREGDPNSRGYCQNLERAEAFGSKGHNVVAAVCNLCPAYQACEERGYLAQFNALREKPIVIGRFVHAQMQELTKGRGFIAFDEGPISVVTEKTELALDDFKLRELRAIVLEQFREEVAALDAFLTALRSVIASNQAKRGRYAVAANVKLGGKWLFDQLDKTLARETWEQVMAFDGAMIERLNTQIVRDLADIPPNYLPDLLAVMRYEYTTYYRNGATGWNSRLIPFGHSLRLYPMRPFAIGIRTKLIALDATGLKELYDVAFTDTKGRPRQPIVYDKQITPPETTVITQYTGTENAKSTLLRQSEETDKLEPSAPEAELPELSNVQGRYTIEATMQEADRIRPYNPALAQLMILMHTLALNYGDRLLIIAYKGLLATDNAFLRKWIKRSGILPVDNLQYYGNVRGKNDWEDFAAVLCIGTPRMQAMELLALAQVLSWRDPVPVNASRQERQEPYMMWDNDEGPKAYVYIGYEDERVNRIAVNHTQSELRQAADRNRAFSSRGERYQHIASAFPCTQIVHRLAHWDSAHFSASANVVLERWRYQLEQEQDCTADPLGMLLREIIEWVKCTEKTARKYLDDELNHGKNYLTGRRWRDTFDITDGWVSLVSRRGEPRHERTKEYLVCAAIEANPSLNNLTREQLFAYMQRSVWERRWHFTASAVRDGREKYRKLRR